MQFNAHSALEGKHAFLSASQYHWINYDEKKIIDSYNSFMAKQRGTELHDFAKRCIELKIKLPKSKRTLNEYVNDAIGFGMKPEQPLYYSEYCFGTADAISFNKDFLRIHDLKTGATPASMKQLLVYTSLFCLEYHKKPIDIHAELRIYQSDDVVIYEPTVDDILPIMDKIVAFDKCLTNLNERG